MYKQKKEKLVRTGMYYSMLYNIRKNRIRSYQLFLFYIYICSVLIIHIEKQEMTLKLLPFIGDTCINHSSKEILE